MKSVYYTSATTEQQTATRTQDKQKGCWETTRATTAKDVVCLNDDECIETQTQQYSADWHKHKGFSELKGIMNKK